MVHRWCKDDTKHVDRDAYIDGAQMVHRMYKDGAKQRTEMVHRWYKDVSQMVERS
jgi:hypothetical protein